MCSHDYLCLFLVYRRQPSNSSSTSSNSDALIREYDVYRFASQIVSAMEHLASLNVSALAGSQKTGTDIFIASIFCHCLAHVLLLRLCMSTVCG